MAAVSKCSSPAISILDPSMHSERTPSDNAIVSMAVRRATVEEARPASVPPAEASSLDLALRALRPLLANPDVTELCINRPGEAFLELRSGWRREALPFADFDWCRRLEKLVANSTRQRIDEESPLLSAALSSGEGIQTVLPPAATPGFGAITIPR